jgi:hypothetical protein
MSLQLYRRRQWRLSVDDERIVINRPNQVEVTWRENAACRLGVYDHFDVICRVGLTERDLQMQHAIVSGFGLEPDACQLLISRYGFSLSPRTSIS